MQPLADNDELQADQASMTAVQHPTPNVVIPDFQLEMLTAKFHLRTRRLAIAELTLSCALLVFGIVAGALYNECDYYGMSYSLIGSGAPFWAPIFGIISAVVALASMRYGLYHKTSAQISHFLTCIVSTMSFIALLALSCLAIRQEVPDMWYGYGYRYGYGPPDYQSPCRIALISFEALLLLGSVANMGIYTSSIIYIFDYWCKKATRTGLDDKAPAVAQTNIYGMVGQIQAVSYPPKSQFVYTLSTEAVQPQAP